MASLPLSGLAGTGTEEYLQSMCLRTKPLITLDAVALWCCRMQAYIHLTEAMAVWAVQALITGGGITEGSIQKEAYMHLEAG
jgi:hypothetical protein